MKVLYYLYNKLLRKKVMELVLTKYRLLKKFIRLLIIKLGTLKTPLVLKIITYYWVLFLIEGNGCTDFDDIFYNFLYMREMVLGNLYSPCVIYVL